MLIFVAGCSGTQNQLPIETIEIPTMPGKSQTQVAQIIGTATAKSKLTEMVLDQTATILALAPSSTPTITLTPAITPTPNPSPTPDATLLAWATIDALGDPCQPNASVEQYGSGVSPDGKWVAISCYAGSVSAGRDSFLQVLSLDRIKTWRLYFRDYANGGGYDAKDSLTVYRWSPDGKYLYAMAGTRLSGCCWIGNRLLLVRLNLETGAQIAFLNGMSESGPNPLNFAISEDARYLFQPQRGSLDITTLATGETQRVELQFQRSIDANFVLMSPAGDQIILGLFYLPDDGYHYILESIALINLISGKQSIVMSGMTDIDSLYPILWQDADHILLTNSPYSPWLADFWLLNIQTGELVRVENP